jgi:hypothetical protein
MSMNRTFVRAYSSAPGTFGAKVVVSGFHGGQAAWPGTTLEFHLTEIES